MIPTVSVLLALLASPTPAIPPVTLVPLGGVLDSNLTRVYAERAEVETRAALEQLERDTSRPASEKREIRKRLDKLRLAVYTTPNTVDACVAAYERTIPRTEFLFAVRNLAADLADGIKSGAIRADAAALQNAAGKTGRTARWHREDGGLEIDIEEYLLDPRDGSITKKTVVLVTTLAD